MNKKRIIIGVILAVVLAGFGYHRFTLRTLGEGGEQTATEAGESGEKGGARQEDEAAAIVALSVETQRQHGVVVVAARKEHLAGTVSATGKVEVNGDRIAHVSPRIPGKIASVRASLGESIGAGQVLAMLDSVELDEAVNRYRQSRAKLSLAKNNLERVQALVEKKIAARKEIYQAETDYQMSASEFHADEERLARYGLSPAGLAEHENKRQLLPVRAPIGGVITEKHAIVGELADPAKNLYTVADLSSLWVMVDINEKELAKIRTGQEAIVTVGAFPELKFRGRISHIADVVDDATRTVKARIEVHNAGRKLKPEMFASVELSLPDEAPPVLTVPLDAIQDLEGKKVVFVTENGTEFAPRALALGRASGGQVEVLDGLREGERYAVTGGFLLKSELKKGELGEE